MMSAPPAEILAENRCRERRVDEAGGDQIDADRRELEREIGDERGERDSDCRDDRKTDSRAASAHAAHECQGATRPPG
jgi:hypothetical protein